MARNKDYEELQAERRRGGFADDRVGIGARRSATFPAPGNHGNHNRKGKHPLTGGQMKKGLPEGPAGLSSAAAASEEGGAP